MLRWRTGLAQWFVGANSNVFLRVVIQWSYTIGRRNGNLVEVYALEQEEEEMYIIAPRLSPFQS